MAEESTTGRMLALLSLLQTHRYWSGAELADRLGVSRRTVRRDIERLRELGYRLASTRGTDGGYQLEAGADLPPLVLTDEEAVSLAVALRTAASSTPLVGVAETNVAVLAKLDQVLPARLRARVRAVQSATATGDPIAASVPVDAELLVQLAFACRDREIVRLEYLAADGTASNRRVEPVALVPHRRRWYLLCWDLGRQDWRTLRVDRIGKAASTRVPFAERRVPGGPAAFVARQVSETPVHVAVVTIHADYAEASRYLGDWVSGLEDAGAGRTRWRIEAERMERLAGALVWLPWPFEVQGSPEFTALLQEFGERLRRVAG